MSTFRNPVGPQPSSVYWRRRLLVLLALLAVIVAVLLIVAQPGSANSDAEASASDTAGDGSANDAGAKDGSAADNGPADDPEPEETLVEGAPCNAENITIEAITDKAVYAAGELPQLSFSITNTSAVTCEYNVGTTQQAFVVSSGEDLYWSSRDCETSPVDAPLLLEPNLAVTSAPIPWDRTRSSVDTCEGERPTAPGAGATFRFSVSVGEVEATAPKSFLLY